MGIKKRNKVNAQFNMSSLTDIIFLLLIFFMLTSNLVNPNALNLKMPGKSRSQMPSTSELNDVSIRSNGRYYWDGQRISEGKLEAAFRNLSRNSGSKASITISPDPDAPIENVAEVMDLAMRYRINAIMAAEIDE